MIKSLLSGLVLAVVATGANAAVINDLFDTGVNAGGVSLADNSADPHYVLTSVPGGTSTVRTKTSASGFPVGPWIGDSATSTWIGPASDSQLDGPGGIYTYETTFTLPVNAVLSSAAISGFWAADDGDATNDVIKLNGVTVSTGNAGFSNYTAFSIGAGAFVTGVNTLQFFVQNGSFGPTGLRVDGIAGSFSTIPEPASLGLLGVAGLALVRRRKA